MCDTDSWIKSDTKFDQEIAYGVSGTTQNIQMYLNYILIHIHVHTISKNQDKFCESISTSPIIEIFYRIDGMLLRTENKNERGGFIFSVFAQKGNSFFILGKLNQLLVSIIIFGAGCRLFPKFYEKS